MPITGDLIKQQEIDTPFTDSQIALIERLSQNSEDQAFHDKTKEWYNQWDQTIFEASGVQKEAREKASDYAKRAFAALKSEKEDFSSALSLYKGKATSLEAEIATLKDGKIDAATTQKITDLNAELASLKQTHQAQLQEKENALAEKEKALLNERVETQFATALNGIAFKKDETTAAMKDIAIQHAKQTLLAEATMDIQDGKLVWRDKAGNIIRNPKNGNEPATTADLLLPKLTPVIDQGRKAGGTGTAGASGGASPSGFAPTAKTKTEFYTQASDYLIAKGEDRTNPDFAKKLTELSKEFNAQDLPV